MKKNKMNNLWKFEQNRTIHSKVMNFQSFDFHPHGLLKLATYRHKMAANVENCPLTLYTKFHIFVFYKKSRQIYAFSVEYNIAPSILQTFQKEWWWFLIWNMILTHFLINLCTKWMSSSPRMTSQIMLILPI